jgi:hypothetical protein
MLEVAASFLLTIVILFKLDWFLFWIPFLSLTGRWLLMLDIIPLEYQSLCSYAEFFTIIWMTIKYSREKLDNTAVWILLVGLTSIFSLFHAGTHFFYSLFFTSIFIAGPWIYLFFLNNMKEIQDSYLVDWTVLLWTVFGFLNKIYFGAMAGASPIFQRAGGYFGSNRLAGILILLLPLVRRKWIFFLAIALMLTQFSKGILGVLLFYAIVWLITVDRKMIKIAIPALLIGLLFFGQIMSIELSSGTGTISIMDNMIGRFTKADEDNFLRSLIMRVLIDERFDLYRLGIERAHDTVYMGVGLGGSMWEFEKYYHDVYSNFHNLFLTSLVEGGLVFFIAVTVFIIYVTVRAFQVSKPAFVGLLSWIFYGLFSGQLYDVSRAPTCAEYYYLLFVTAFVSFAYANETQNSGAELISVRKQ